MRNLGVDITAYFRAEIKEGTRLRFRVQDKTNPELCLPCRQHVPTPCGSISGSRMANSRIAGNREDTGRRRGRKKLELPKIMFVGRKKTPVAAATGRKLCLFPKSHFLGKTTTRTGRKKLRFPQISFVGGKKTTRT